MTSPNPIEVRLTEEGLLIDCFFSYNSRALLPPKGEKGPSWADMIEQGIREAWSGTWPMTAPLAEALSLFSDRRNLKLDFTALEDLKVKVRIKRAGPDMSRRPARIYVLKWSPLPAHVASPFYRRLWGIFRSGQLESIGLNWSPRHPGTMVIPEKTPAWRRGGVAAHEAGHLFGLGDAYGAWYRFYSTAPGSQGYMMRDNQRVQPDELAMLVRAQATGRMQYFPKIFEFKQVRQGLTGSIKAFFRKFRPRRKARPS